MIIFDKEPAYILHRRPYQEATSLVEFLTAGHGRITAVSRQSSKTLGKNIQPFVPALLWCSGRGELLNLRDFDPQGKAVLTEPEDQMVGMYVNELIMRLVPAHVRSHRLFECYATVLSEIAQPADYEPVLRKFELRVLEITGHGLQLEHDLATGEPLIEDALYQYTPGKGPTRCARVESGRLLCRGKTLLDLNRGLQDGDPRTLREAKSLLRTVIDYHLKDRTIHTRSVFRYLREVT